MRCRRARARLRSTRSRRLATSKNKLPRGRRVAASDDLELSAYLEIASGVESAVSDEDEGQHPSTSSGVHEGIVVIDFGSQYSHLIARRVRELKVYSEIAAAGDPWEKVERINPKGIILSGGPASVYEEGAPRIPDWVFERRLPILGICYGMQALVHQLGGEVSRGVKQEFGYAVLHQDGPSATGWADDESPLFQGLPPSFQVWMSHGDRVESLPPGFSGLAFTENSPVAAIGNGLALDVSGGDVSGGAPMFGLQFHPK